MTNSYNINKDVYYCRTFVGVFFIIIISIIELLKVCFVGAVSRRDDVRTSRLSEP